MKPTSPAPTPATPGPTPATPSEHADHDLILIAAHAAGDTFGADRERAAAQIAHCSECAGLAADLVAIAAATRALPAPLRTRDFRLSSEAASRASRRGLRGLGGLFGAANLGWARPLAAALTTLGLAGLVVSAAPVFSLAFGTGGAAVLSTIGSSVGSALQAESGQAAPAASAAPTAAPAASVAASAAPAPVVAAPEPTQLSGVVLPAASSTISAADNGKGRTEAKPGGSAFANEGPSAVPDWVPWLAAGSTLLVIGGLSLFAIRWRANRGT